MKAPSLSLSLSLGRNRSTETSLTRQDSMSESSGLLSYGTAMGYFNLIIYRIIISINLESLNGNDEVGASETVACLV